MKTFKISAIALAVVAAGSANNAMAAAANPAINQTVIIGCTVPGPTGATVYSIDNTVITATSGAGVNSYDTITLTGVAAGAPCSAALNAVVEDYAHLCYNPNTGVLLQGPDISTKNVVSSQSGYTLDEYTISCQ